MYALGGPTEAQQDAEQVLTDVAPLQEQFGEAGRLSDPHWLAYDPDEAERSREFLPNPDARYRVVGVARLPVGTGASIVATPSYAFAPADPADVPDALTQFLPGKARWMSSAAFDRLLLAPGTGHYRWPVLPGPVDGQPVFRRGRTAVGPRQGGRVGGSPGWRDRVPYIWQVVPCEA